MKKVFIIAASVMFCIALPIFAGGQSEPQSAGAAPSASSGPSGTISVFWWGSPIRNQKTMAVIKLFEKAYPNVTVNGIYENWTQYWQKVTVQATAHTLPEVTQTQSRQLLNYTPHNVFLALDDLISQGKIDVSKMPKSILQSGAGSDGKIYMIPYGAAYFGFVYNKTYAEKAGLAAVPQIYTWDQFDKWLREAKAKLPSNVYPVMQEGGESDVFTGYLHGIGYPLFAKSGQLGFPESALRDYWSRWLNYAKEGIALPEDIAVQQGPTIEQYYIVKGNVMVQAMPGNRYPDAQTNANQVNTGEFGIRMYPSGPKGIGGVTVTSGFSIPSNVTGNKREAAAAFINFFTNNPEAAKVFASDNGVVTDTNLLEAQIKDPSLPKATREYLELFHVIGEHNPPIDIYPPGYTAVFTTLFPQIFEKIAFGQMSLDQGVKSFFDQAKQQLGS